MKKIWCWLLLLAGCKSPPPPPAVKEDGIRGYRPENVTDFCFGEGYRTGTVSAMNRAGDIALDGALGCLMVDADIWYDKRMRRFGIVGLYGYTTLSVKDAERFEQWLGDRAVQRNIFFRSVAPGNGIFEAPFPTPTTKE